MTFFFYGPNQYALRGQLQQMVQAYLAKAGSGYGLERIDASSAKARELAGSLQAAPFLASSRLVIVENAATNKTIAEKLPELLGGVPSSTVAVFVEREVDQRTKAYRALCGADKVVKFEPLSGPKLTNWIKAEVTRLGGTIEAAGLRELVDRAGEDQWRLAGEVNKLVHYNSAVTPESVRELVVPSVERSIFDMVEAMTAGASAKALALFADLLRQKESEIYVLTMIQWQLRNLLLAKTAPAGMSPADLAKAAGMSPYVASKMMAAQGRLSAERLSVAYITAVTCEYEIKSGRVKPEPAVHRLIWRVSSGMSA